MKLFIHFSTCLCAAFLITSCDPHVSFHRELTNGSDYTLVLVKQQSGSIDSSEIAPGNTFVYAEESGFGQIKEYEGCWNQQYPYLDSLYLIVKNDTTKTVLVEPIGTKEWHYVKDQESKGSGGGFCHCELVVTNAHIQ